MTWLSLLAMSVAILVASPALAQKPSAERPTYAVGDTWVINGNVYTLVRVEDDTYVFTAPAAGRELHLSKDLVVTKAVVKGETRWELTIANEIPWPLEVGKWRRGRHVSNRGFADAMTTVDAYEDIVVKAGRFKAFKITTRVTTEQNRPIRTLTVWYAPEVRRIVKSENTSGQALNFEVSAVPERGTDVAQQPPAPPAPAARSAAPSTGERAGPAERPAYAVGDRWVVSGLAYEVTRADRDGYVFTAGGGQEIHLTRDLVVFKVVKSGRAIYDVSVPPRWPWPLAAKKFSQSRTVVRSAPDGVPARGSQQAAGDFEVTASVDAVEEVAVAAGRFRAFKVTEEWSKQERGAPLLYWRTTSWYAPAVRRIVKSESSAVGMTFEVTGVDERPPAVASAPAPPAAAAAPPPTPPAAATPPPPATPPVSRTPPAIALLEPKPGALVRGAETTLKVEVRSDSRLKSLVVKGRGGDTTYTPRAGAKAGEPWIVEAKVALAEGGNTVRLEAVDEFGGRAAETIHLARQSLITVELDGPPHASVRVDQDQHALDANGKLTLELPAGRYQLEATKDGFLPLRQPLQVDGRQKKVAHTLALVARVAPTITILAPAPGAVVSTPDAKLKVEVKSRHRLSALRIGRASDSAQQSFAPQGAAKAGETWLVEPVVVLNEGANTFKLEAVDEHGTRSEQTLTLTRRTAVAAPPSPADLEAPKIAINYPAADAKIESESIVILGLVTDNGAVERVQITVNGMEIAQPRDLAAVGRGVPLRVPAPLQVGPNVIEVTAADKAGNVAQVVRTVTRPGPAVAAAPPPAGPKISNRWAVVVGVGDYDNRTIPKLRFATRDAEAMYRFLTTQGGYPKDNVILLTDTSAQKPTLLNIKRALGDFLARRAGRDDMVLIYFAGHGAPEVDAAGNEADGLSKYLIPRDVDPESLYTTALPMDEIQRIFSRVAAERIVMLLDTCYSGVAGGRTFARASTRATGLNDQFLDRLTRSRGRVIMTASGPNEVALELPALGHGVFTYYVLEGLKGKADRNSDGLVTVSELYEYVEDQVDATARRAGGRQRPLMKGEIEGTLPLSKTR